jgi:hypothetical protein
LIRRLLFCSDSKSQLSLAVASPRSQSSRISPQEDANEEDGSNIESITALWLLLELLVLLFGIVFSVAAIAAIIRSGCCCR